MAQVTIELEINEFALYDYVARVNGFWVAQDGNFTTETAALEDAHEKVRAWNRDRRAV